MKIALTRQQAIALCLSIAIAVFAILQWLEVIEIQDKATE